MCLVQPVLCVPDKCLLAGEALVARGHVAVGIVVKAVNVADAVDSVVRTGIAVAVALAVERGQPVGVVVAVGAAVAAAVAAGVAGVVVAVGCLGETARPSLVKLWLVVSSVSAATSPK